MILQPANQQSKRGRPPVPEYPERTVQVLAPNKLLVRDWVDAVPYVVTFATPEMLNEWVDLWDATPMGHRT